MADTTITNLPAAASANANAVVAADNAAATATEKVTLAQIATLANASAPVQSVAGKTGTVTLAKGDVGLGNVDNTSDANKPVSTAQAAADSAVQAAAASDATSKANAAQAAAVQRANHTGTQDAATITGTFAVARLPTVLEQQVAVGNSGTSTTLSLASGSFQTVTLNGNCTFTMPAAAAGASLTLLVTQNGSFTAAFTGVIWPNGAAPVITPTATKRDILVFVSDGTNWFGSFSQNF